MAAAAGRSAVRICRRALYLVKLEQLDGLFWYPMVFDGERVQKRYQKNPLLFPGQKAAQSAGRLAVLRLHGVRVDVHGHRGVRMPEPPLHRLRVDAMGEQQG